MKSLKNEKGYLIVLMNPTDNSVNIEISPNPQIEKVIFNNREDSSPLDNNESIRLLSNQVIVFQAKVK